MNIRASLESNSYIIKRALTERINKLRVFVMTERNNRCLSREGLGSINNHIDTVDKLGQCSEFVNHDRPGIRLMGFEMYNAIRKELKAELPDGEKEILDFYETRFVTHFDNTTFEPDVDVDR